MYNHAEADELCNQVESAFFYRKNIRIGKKSHIVKGAKLLLPVNTPSIPNYKVFQESGESKDLKFDQIYMIR
jgi:hypothetical protein